MDEKTKLIGLRNGIDVNALFLKYSSVQKAYTSSLKKEVASDGNLKSDSIILDNMIVCNICGGSGLMKINYNHQVREVNCSNCGAEGFLERKCHFSRKTE